MCEYQENIDAAERTPVFNVGDVVYWRTSGFTYVVQENGFLRLDPRGQTMLVEVSPRAYEYSVLDDVDILYRAGEK